MIFPATLSYSPMKIAISGASGLVASAVTPFLTDRGHEVWRLTRRSETSEPRTLIWDPGSRRIPSDQLEGFDAFLHLAGENISSGRWTAAKKSRIHNSRVEGTQFLAETLAGLRRRPTTLLSASAIGFYGNRGGAWLTEDSATGDDFLTSVAREWEAATAPAEHAGIRIVHLRFGIILTPHGGALARLLPLFRLGLGGIAGNGRQFWSWVSIDDTCRVIDHLLATPSLRGPVNVVAPNPVTNQEFTKTLGRVLHRPTILPVPAFALRIALGEMANATVLSSARVRPEKLLASAYSFRHPELEPALRHLLSRA
ncbi:MAG TPA: TIGR01777 family oxidoreductase [Verrucomicrobiae bacterium]|jgi:uncharacterized protein (TIGR01777 family)